MGTYGYAHTYAPNNHIPVPDAHTQTTILSIHKHTSAKYAHTCVPTPTYQCQMHTNTMPNTHTHTTVQGTHTPVPDSHVPETYTH